MTTQQIVVYALAISFALLWLGTTAYQVKKKSRELIKGVAKNALSFGEWLVGFSLGILGIVLFLGAIAFTVAPFFYPQITRPLSPIHIAGSIVDWAAFLFVDALLKNLKEVSDNIRDILSGHLPGRFDMRGVEGVRPNAKQLDMIQPKEEVSPDMAELQEAHAGNDSPVTIVREIPDSWLA